MGNDFTFTLRGADDVVKKLKTFTPKLQKKGLRTAARKSMNIVRDSAREAARGFDDPETPERIDRLIVTQENARKSKQVGGVVMRVGVRGGAKRSKERVPPWYWRLKEFGTGHLAATPFMRLALEKNVSRVTEKFVTEINNEIDKLDK